MFWVMLYFVVAYAIALPAACIVFGTGTRLRKWKLKYVAVLIACAPVVPYVVVEAQTALLMPQLRAPLNKALVANYDPTSYCYSKVIWYGISKVAVLVVIPTRNNAGYVVSTNGLVYELEASKEGWVFRDYWSVAWSDQGSADGNVFPPYPDECFGEWMKVLTPGS